MVQRVFMVLIFVFGGYCATAQYLQQPERYLSHPEVSQDARDYYSRVISITDSRVYSILDSIFTDNDSTRPFYTYLVCRMLTEADEKLLIELNIVCRYMTEYYPSTLLSVLFAQNSSITDKHRELWAHRIAVELRITCANDLMNCFKTSRMSALEHCALIYKSKLELMYNLVRKDLNLFQQG